MKKYTYTFLALLLCSAVYGQTNTFPSSGNVGIGTTSPLNTLDVNGTLRIRSEANFGGSAYTSIQLADKSWSGSHAVLFNAYKSENQVNRSNTKYSNDVGPYYSGAGSIIYFGNGGTIGFYISQHSSGKDTKVDLGIPKMCIKRNGNIGVLKE